MSRPAIQIEKLGKLYRIGLRQKRHDTLRDQIAHGVRSLFLRNGRSQNGAGTFWALKDVSFEINEGEVVGIIGRNGAGKSTLLKILSRITEPTLGRAKIHGRVGSLLEVGTGFHPELSGRENIYLNGAILGMRNAEINRKFDEIVGFSEIDKFVDTPVKRYSSGMYVRLAFAVAAHLEPEVLIIDEVLAVGDTAFQKKCLGKMGEVAGQGRTVLFVSHNMAAVQNLCKSAIVLDGGKLAFIGRTDQAITYYLQSLSCKGASWNSRIDLTQAEGRPSKYRPILTFMELFSELETPFNGYLQVGAPLKIETSFRLQNFTRTLCICLIFENNLGQRIIQLTSIYQGKPPAEYDAGEHTLVCDIPSLPLLPGEYKIWVFVDIDGINVDRVEDAVRIQVVESDYYGNGHLPEYGHVVVPHTWSSKEC